MLETNIRIVEGGAKLKLETRMLRFEGSESGPKLGEIAVSFLRRDRQIASVVSGDCLLALTSGAVATVERNREGNPISIRDTGRVRTLQFSNPKDRQLMVDLMARQLELQVGKVGNWWTLDSLRIWYEQVPFTADAGVAAWRRYELNAVHIEGEGIGLVVDVSTAFITQHSVADYFVRGTNGAGDRRHEFERLTARQEEQKGTLIYDNGNGSIKCWFEEWCAGMTCATTGTVTGRGARQFPSLYEYALAQCRRELKPEAPVARVSFQNLGTQKVPAEWLRVRVMNDAVPASLKQVDKIDPAERSTLIAAFWRKLGNEPLGAGMPKLRGGFWQPSRDRVLRLRLPRLLFGSGHELAPPETDEINHIRAHFRNRERCLAKYGCWYVPQTVLRKIHLAIRRDCGENTGAWLAAGIQRRLSVSTKRQINVELISAGSLDDLKKQLRQVSEPGLAVIVFPDRDPATYHDLEYELDQWRIKRITERQLRRKAQQLPADEPEDDRAESNSANWETFVDKCALDVLELLECIPYIPMSPASFEARFGVDVGHTRRHFAVSLIVWRRIGDHFEFWTDTRVCAKADYKKEEINPYVLADEMIELAKSAAQAGIKGINSLLGVRDGKECREETGALEKARGGMEACGFLSQGARIDHCGFYKNSVKGIRLWDRGEDGQVRQALEGSAVKLSDKVVIAQFTGAATLRQGTAEPLILHSPSGNAVRAMEDEFDLAQCNWASPAVAQRLPVELKRTDDELSHRMAQEVKRIR